MSTTTNESKRQALAKVAQAADAGKISATAAKNVNDWLTEKRYAEYAPEVIAHIEADKWQQLDDVFWTVIPFGTGGRRGKMYPIGSNAINDRTIGESAQGLADYVKEVVGRAVPDATKSHAQTDRQAQPDLLSCAIAYDTRHRSEHFARLCLRS